MSGTTSSNRKGEHVLAKGPSRCPIPEDADVQGVELVDAVSVEGVNHVQYGREIDYGLRPVTSSPSRR